MNVKNILGMSFILLTMITLTACSSHRHPTSARGEGSYEGSDIDNGVLSGQSLSGESMLDADGQPIVSQEQLLAVHTYRFAYDSADIDSNDKPAVIAQAHYLATHPEKHVLLAGNTDSRGSPEYNIDLGWRRAQSVEDLMLLNGASKAQIQLVSYGEEKPVAFGDSIEAYQQNRRVDLTYVA